MTETFDFVVVGSGGGSMCAALVLRAAGKSVLILEKAELVGGTTATSGGVMWIPNNRFMKAGRRARQPRAGDRVSRRRGRRSRRTCPARAANVAAPSSTRRRR
jgi:succinate dehydrogenase/fumarate reductase flavoprotein subunit